jgi:molybdopterin converting factor small subunit
VTVNRQFSEPFTRIDDGDEVALVPTSPTAPVAG